MAAVSAFVNSFRTSKLELNFDEFTLILSITKKPSLLKTKPKLNEYLSKKFLSLKESNPIKDNCQFLIFYFFFLHSSFQLGCPHYFSGGYYFKIDRIERLLQILIWIYLPDTNSRHQFGLPPQANVDFRAACFCHRQLVDVGFVCSVCLSIFCKFSPICTTCNTVFANMPNMLKKKKAK